MSTTTLILSLLTLASAILHIRAEYRGPRRHVYLFKPLTTSLILLLALLATPAAPPFYKPAIILGLLFSLAGDIFLMLPQDRFLPGLVSFLIAHLWYIVAFSLRPVALLTTGWVLLLLLYGLLMARLLLPAVSPRLKLPVLLYMLIILIMAWRALEQWAQRPGQSTTLALAGALLFVLSDSLLALNRFRRPLPAAQLLILSTYYAAQWLIALSISPG